jgi:dipeptidyl aminopeptidase/acylaminoacyl peptidase
MGTTRAPCQPVWASALSPRALSPLVRFPLVLATLLQATLALALPAGVHAQASQVTIEGLLAAPFASDMRAAPEGGAVVWAQTGSDGRNLWVAEAPDYQGRLLTPYPEDDGQEVGSVQWLPDSRSLVYVRGGAPNRQGEIPNPTSHPDGAERALWWISLADGEPVRIGEGSGPAVRPDGAGVAFLRGGNIWYAELDGTAVGVGEPRVLARVRGGIGSLTWSPDARRLAFVSNRGTHAFIGVLDVDARAVTWMDPTVDQDGNPAWSPDGTRIAFTRFSTSSAMTSFAPVREARPWSIRVADVDSGEAREVWRAEEGVGSRFYGITADNPILWGDGDRLIFPWERTGWVLLYAVPASGGQAALLTPGDFEVEDVALSHDRRHIYYSSNQDDLHRRHLWRVAVAGGAPEPLTPGEGIQWNPTPLSNGALAFLRSGARTPSHAVVIPADEVGPRSGERARPLVARGAPGGIPEDFPEVGLVVPTNVTVTASDGMEVPAQLFLPPDLAPGERRPAVAFFHGGSRRQMMLGFHHRIYYHHSYALNQYLATQGYVVLSVNFRSGTGYGMEFREALHYGATGASEVHDLTGAGLYLKARDDVDPDRIGLWGGSYGGYLTAQGLARASDLWAAGVDIHGVHDWNVGIATFRPDFNPLEDPERTRLAFESSPMSQIDRWRSPVLVIHGDDDRNVRFVETVTLVEALRERDVHAEQLVFPDEVHSFLVHRNWIRTLEATADFFHRMMGGGR